MDSDNKSHGTRKRSTKVKFPRTRRDRVSEEGNQARESGPDPWRVPDEPPDNAYEGQPMQQYPSPPYQPKNVNWADLADASTDNAPYLPRDGEGDRWQQKEYFGGDCDVPLAANEDSWSDGGALNGTTLGKGGQTEEVPRRDGGEPRPWIQIEPSGDAADSTPVEILGPPGRTPPPSRRGFQIPEDSDEDDEDDVFINETVPTIVFDDPPMTTYAAVEPGHPLFGRYKYLPSQYQHTLDYLYGLNTIREVDESLLYGQQKPWKEEASDCDMFSIVISLFAYLLNVAADIWLALEYFHYNHYWWFALTLTFILLPSLAMTLFSLVLYIQDHRILRDKVSSALWAMRAFFLIFLVAPIMRIIDTLRFGVKSRQSEDWRERRYWYQRMRDEDTDSSLVRLFETFMENAPQLVLQMYVITQLGTSQGLFLVMVQITGLVISLLAMAWSLVGFQSALRSSLPDKADMKMGGKLMMFLWRVMTISARVIALALFASYFKYWVLLVIGIHFVVMFGWMTKQNTAYCLLNVTDEKGEESTCHSTFLEFLFRLMAAFVHIFCFFNLLESPTRLRCLFYYTLVYIENAAMILAWYITASTVGESGWFQMPALGLVLGGFFVGIIFQVMYYIWCHPNISSEFHQERRIQWYVPCNELSLFHGLEVVENPEKKPLNKPEEDATSDVARSQTGKSDYGRSEVSSFGPANAPVGTSTPAPSTLAIGGGTPNGKNLSVAQSPVGKEIASVTPTPMKERPAPVAEPEPEDKRGARTETPPGGKSVNLVRPPVVKSRPHQKQLDVSTSSKITEV